MEFNYLFKTAQDVKDFNMLASHLLLDSSFKYDGYEEWIYDVALPELIGGYKKCIVAFSGERSERKLVANLIYQPHKQFPRVREFKNMRIHPEVENRFFMPFMLRQGEKEDENDYDALICDVPWYKIKVINTLKVNGWEELMRAPIYGSNIVDVVMVKRFERTPSGFFVPIMDKMRSIA